MGVTGLFGKHILGISKINKYRNLVNRRKILSRDDEIQGDADEYFYKIYNGIVSSFSIDFNGLMHAVSAKVFGSAPRITEKELKHGRMPLKPLSKKEMKEKFNEFKEALWDNIVLLYNVARPTDAFIIAVDGMAPYGKILQQRKRRFTKDTFYNPIFDSNCITPGTEFMFELDDFLRRKIKENAEGFANKIIYSSHMSEGEGEHKIFEYLRNGQIPTDDGKVHIIHGLDGDLIMLSVLSPTKNIIFLREAEDKYGDSESNPDYIYADLIEINVLGEYLEDNKIPVEDYVLMGMLVGNDFLPHSPSLKHIDTTIDMLLEIHNKSKLQLVINGDINWKSLKVLMSELKKQEFNRIKNRSNDINPMHMISQSMVYDEKKKITQLDPAIFRDLWYTRCFWGGTNRAKFIEDILSLYEEEEEEEYTGILDYTEEDVEDMCFDYLRTLQWNFIYYNEGFKHASSAIGYKYDFAPFFIDLENKITDIYNEDITEIVGVRATPGIPDYFSVLHQLVCVIPPTSINLIPEPIEHLFKENSPIVDLFPIGWVSILEGDSREHMKLHRLPIPDRQRIINTLSTINFDPKVLSKWIPQKDLVIDMPKNIMMERNRDATELRERMEKHQNGGNKGDSKRGGYQSRGRGEGGYKPRGRGQGGYKPRGRGEYNPRGRGEYKPRGRGEYKPRGQGGYQPRGKSEEVYQPRETGGYQSSRGRENARGREGTRGRENGERENRGYQGEYN